VETRSLYIEALIRFPELSAGTKDPAVPQVFKHMVLNDKDKKLTCRVRLKATYTRGAVAVGDIEEKIYWIMSLSLPA
jgi:hypothetical protein